LCNSRKSFHALDCKVEAQTKFCDSFAVGYLQLKQYPALLNLWFIRWWLFTAQTMFWDSFFVGCLHIHKEKWLMLTIKPHFRSTNNSFTLKTVSLFTDNSKICARRQLKLVIVLYWKVSTVSFKVVHLLNMLPCCKIRRQKDLIYLYGWGRWLGAGIIYTAHPGLAAAPGGVGFTPAHSNAQKLRKLAFFFSPLATWNEA
jgi:hypothetical protein